MGRKAFIITSFACFSLSFSISMASLARWDPAGKGLMFQVPSRLLSGRKPDELLRQSPNRHGKHLLGYGIFMCSKTFYRERADLHCGSVRSDFKGFPPASCPTAASPAPSRKQGSGGTRGIYKGIYGCPPWGWPAQRWVRRGGR